MSERRRLMLFNSPNNPLYRIPIAFMNKYKQYESITSNGTEWIDTGYSGYIALEVDIQPIIGTTWRNRIGIRDSQTTIGLQTPGANDTRFYLGNSRDGTNYPNIKNTVSAYSRRTFKSFAFESYQYCEINGTSQTVNLPCTDLILPTTNFLIFKDGLYGDLSKNTLYYLKIWSDRYMQTIERDYIPAKRNSDNRIGLLDVSKSTPVFYPNLGSGAFTVGREILPYV